MPASSLYAAAAAFGWMTCDVDDADFGGALKLTCVASNNIPAAAAASIVSALIWSNSSCGASTILRSSSSDDDFTADPGAFGKELIGPDGKVAFTSAVMVPYGGAFPI